MRRLLPLAVSALLLLPVWPATAVVADPPVSSTGEVHTVTLITGDQVQLSKRSDGTHETIFVPAKGREHIGHVQTGDSDNVVVIPRDAEIPLAEGKLDPRLFDVTGLVKQGVSTELPLIVDRSAQKVTSVGAQEIWRSLSDVTKIWLDGKRQVLDDVSNKQIGVPAAWESGFKGNGVKVAVIDTGVDVNHPDLAGKVVATKDFTGTGFADNHGHGTHVAGIVAGTGQASGGQYAGVAPEATLIAAKVCPTGSCSESAIVAGMEWAAEQGADIANVSLGGPDSPGIDPMEDAVNRLPGTLFVIAAGNDGPGDRTVSSPSTADAALSVASVNASDAVSRFSSRGPRAGDSAVKPEIAAPGENIAAPRASGTGMGTPIDANYTRASGTSMATPHVAGAAALLAQARPSLTSAQLKAALASTALPLGGSVNAQGAGRVDVARAVTQTVYATPATTFGLLRYPSSTAPEQTKPVTFTNAGDTDVTLDLTVSATGPSGTDGLFTLSSNQVVVPARGSAEVGVTVHPSLVPATAFGAYTGRITATDGKNVTQTVFSVATEEESYNVDINLIDRSGKAPTDAHVVYVTKLHTLPTVGEPGSTVPYVIRDGRASIRLTKGEWAFNIAISDGNSGTLLVEPLVRTDSNISLTFDARRGVPAGFKVPRADAVSYYNTLFTQYTAQTADGRRANKFLLRPATNDNVFIAPVEAPVPDRFAFGIQGQLGSAPTAAEPFVYNLAWGEGGRIGTNLLRRYTSRQLATFVSRYRALGVPDTVAERAVMPKFLPTQNLITGPYLTVPLPTRKRTEYYGTEPGVTYKQVMTPHHTSVPVVGWGRMDGNPETYRAGSVVTKNWNTAGLSTQTDIHDSAQGIWRDGNRLVTNFSVFTPEDPGLGSLFLNSQGNGTNVLERDGTVLRNTPFPDIGGSNVPADEGRYTVTSTASRNVAYSALSTKVTAAWTFTSAPTSALTYLSVPTVRVSGDFDDYNRAHSGCSFPLRITARTQDGASASRITSVSLEVSDDDGLTWKRVRVHGNRDALVQHPDKPGGFISLRVRAVAADGDTVEQTIIRAYGLT
ncbi:S8 family serine peptidase [Lentzea alba]|uniref:S8 family peptidase n=1 Tax=Lentzea alba TaxID=2714351 RepID=UPI0039BFCEDB